ncbi:MAG TPA: hypothetical protein VEL28_15865, partial [Candidatus Binatia bacterium]|nr:hypothetical protein [Candidatus Binatia bacterium]
MSGVLQAKGVAAAEVIAELESRASGDADWRTGKMLMGLYDPGPGAHEVALAAYTRFLAQNALYINMYPSIA